MGGGKKQTKLRLGLGPAIDNGLVFAANHKGEMLAVSLETGRDVWVKKLKVPISAGPAAGFGMVVAGTSKGAVIALDGATGRQLWRSQINSELLSSPAISQKVVVMRSVDGRLNGFDAHTGKVLWSVEQQVPRLSLRGTATPTVAKEIAISGFDNGKVMAVSLTTGDTIWDTVLASPHGRTELDRLVDIDSAVRVVGDNVFAAGFQVVRRCSRLTRASCGGRTICRAIEGWRSMRIICTSPNPMARSWRCVSVMARRFGATRNSSAAA